MPHSVSSEIAIILLP